MFADFKIMGNLTHFPDYRAYAKDKFKCNISIAVNRKKGEDADYYNLTAFGQTADYLHKYATKGQRIYVEGYMSQKVSEKDNKRYTNYTITKVDLCGDGKFRTQDENQRKAEKAVQQAQSTTFRESEFRYDAQPEWATASNEMPMDDDYGTLPF